MDTPSTEYTVLKKYITLCFQKPYTTTKIIALIANGVRYSAQFKAISGSEKKSLVLSVIRDVIMESDINEYERSDLILVVDTLGDVAIDELVAFGKDMVTFMNRKCCKSASCSIM